MISVNYDDDYENYPDNCNCKTDTCEKSFHDAIDDNCCPTCKQSLFKKLEEINKLKEFQNTSLFKPCCPGHGYLHHDNYCSVKTSFI